MSHAIEATRQYVATLHADDHTGHDMSHVERVVRLAEVIAEGEAVDNLVVTLAALLHDVEDHKLGRPAGLVRLHLDTLSVTENQKRHILTVIEESSYSKGVLPSSRESAILQDADRLDAIGAIGIARTFQFAGSRGTALHDGPGSAIAHFEDKLLKLARGMHTEKARQLAMERHAFMEAFLHQFEKEWNGICS